MNLLLRTYNQKICALCLMSISNIMIFKDSVENNKVFVIKMFENNNIFIEMNLQKTESYLIFSSFLKIFHNVISIVEDVIDLQIIKNIVNKTLEYFD